MNDQLIIAFILINCSMMTGEGLTRYEKEKLIASTQHQPQVGTSQMGRIGHTIHSAQYLSDQFKYIIIVIVVAF